MIDKTPKVGRYLLKESPFIHGFCYRGGLITKVAGKRIYIDCEYGSPGYERVEPEYVMKYAAICDTREEMQVLLEHSKKCMADHKDQVKQQQKEWSEFFGEV